MRGMVGLYHRQFFADIKFSVAVELALFAAGFWIEGGQIQHPVEEVTIAGNLRDMFANISVAGDDVDRRGNLQCGSLLLDGMTIAGS